MKTLFHIDHPEPRTGEDTLLCEWGEHYCCYTVYNQEAKKLHGLYYFTFEQSASIEEIEEVIRQLRSSTVRYSRVIFSSGYPQAVLVPRKVFSENQPINTLFNPDKRLTYFHDHIGEWQIMNSYAFPKAIYNSIQEAFGTVEMSHVYSTSIKTYNGYTADSQVSIDFTAKSFRVIVKKEGQVQLAQMYHYLTPLDVVYYLLKILQEFGLSKENTQIILSGLIEENSALYKELHSYFLNLHFVHPSGMALVDKEYPQHFFASIYNLALCVS